MEDGEPLYVPDDVAVAVSAASSAVAAATAASVTDVVAVTTAEDAHALSLGIDDADDLLRRHEMGGDSGDATSGVEALRAHELPPTLPSVPGAHPPASVSAVYRFYEIEATLSLKRREESSIAKCRLCKEEGRQERKGCVRFSKSVTSNLWRHMKENHPTVYEKHAGEKKTIQMHKLIGAGKRGRKKKPVVSSVAAGADENERFLEDIEGGEGGVASETAPRAKPTKRARRQPVGDQFFSEYALSMSGTSGQNTLSAMHGNNEKRPVNLDRVREAVAYMCIYEMVPFELCSSLAFRNLLAECHAGSALLEDAGALASVFGKQAILMQSKKLIEDVKERVAVQLKSVDGVHLQITEWAPPSHREEGSQIQFVGVFAVALDQEFNLVRRCLCAVPVASSNGDAPDDDVGSQMQRADVFKRALRSITHHRHVPNLAVVEPSRRTHFSSLCSANKLEVLESISSLLRDIMVSTITGASLTHPFMVGSELSTEGSSSGSFDRVFDTSRFVEASNHSDVELQVSLHAEAPSSILTELPNVLTGHTIRDILLKVLHLIAHIKQSKETRNVMRKIVTSEFSVDADTYTEMFEKGSSSIIVGIQTIYEVLNLTLKMMPTLQRYFELHKDGTSDLSKLMQLASLSAYEWERVGYLSSLLKPFADAVLKLQDEKFVTSSLIIPSVYTLLEKLRPHAEGGAESHLPEDMVALKTLAYAQLTATFGYLFVEPAEDWSSQQRSSFNWLWSATLLDPRTRPFIIKGALTAAQFWEVVKNEAGEISGMNKAKDKENGLGDLPEHPIGLDDEDHVSNGVDGAGSTTDTNENVPASGDLWDDLQANLTSCAQEEMLLASSKSGLELTKSNNLLEVEISFLQDESRISLKANPLDWWQSMRVKYPYVARLARYVLSVPGSPAVDENPILNDAGLVRRLFSQMTASEVSEFVTTSMNLRLEKQVQQEATTRQMWSTV